MGKVKEKRGKKNVVEIHIYIHHEPNYYPKVKKTDPITPPHQPYDPSRPMYGDPLPQPDWTICEMRLK